jgi:hypothetical protein
MKIQEMIKKFKIELAEKDGVKGFKFYVKPTSAQMEELKSAKPAIMEELEIMKAQREVEQEEREIKSAIAKAEYITNANLKRYLVCCHSEDMEITWSIETLELTTSNIAYQARYLIGNRIDLPQVTAKIKEINAKTFVEYGMAGVAYEITDAEEIEIIAEQNIAIAEFEVKLAAETKIKEAESIAKKIAKEEKIANIFEAAKETGERQLLNKWSDDCNDKNEECDVDLCYEYAMSDGTTKIERHHTW